jgi:hypothetical protein
MYKLSVVDIANICDSCDSFPMVLEYLDPSKYGDTYFRDEYSWYVDNPDSPNVILCIVDDKNIPYSIHLSIIEVSKDKHNKGIGSFILDNFNKIFNTDIVTLTARTNDLINFYSNLDFLLLDKDNRTMIRYYL